MKTCIAVICHKPVKFKDLNEQIYIPVEVGASYRDNHFFENLDNSGDNISNKNESYCELTGLYWLYKNHNFDIIGLVHYRRFFMKSNFCLRKKLINILGEDKIKSILANYDIILPKKRHYYIETNYSHYVHAHKKEALDIMINIVKEREPDYYMSLQKHLKSRSGHYFNMFIASSNVAVPLLDWIFSILNEVEKNINIDEYLGAERRVFGYLSELLFDVYCYKNKLRIRNQKYLFFEKQNRVKKGLNFLLRKIKIR